MKRSIVFMVAILCGHCALYAQKQLCFEYDVAGNQTNAYACVNNTNQPNSIQPLQENPLSLDEKENNSENNEKIILKGAPNPTQGNLTVYWRHFEHKRLVRLYISSLDRKIWYDNMRIDKTLQQLDIDLHHLVPGVYYLIGIFEDGNRKTFRIIKTQ